MKLIVILENRTELLHLQQKLIDKLPDCVDINLNLYKNESVITISIDKASKSKSPDSWASNVDICALKPDPNNRDRIMILCGRKNYPIDFERSKKLAMGRWVSFIDLDIAIKVIMSWL